MMDDQQARDLQTAVVTFHEADAALRSEVRADRLVPLAQTYLDRRAELQDEIAAAERS
jgi:hypothetical protein